MARPRRILVEHGIYHVFSRGNRRQPIFLDERDFARFLQFLDEVVARYGWVVHAYCLMPNHYHLLIETPEANLSEGMHRLGFLYAQWFNWRHDVDGHLFQGRFGARLVESNYHLLETARYIVLNPVRAGLCRHPGDWPWSSYRATAGTARRPRWLTIDSLLAQFGLDRRRAHANYAAFVADAPARASPA